VTGIGPREHDAHCGNRVMDAQEAIRTRAEQQLFPTHRVGRCAAKSSEKAISHRTS
jgi:hypothetical protein